MLSSYELYEPHTLQEACELKQTEGAKIVAGGTDIYVAMHNGSLRPEALIDIKGIKELKEIREEEDHWFFGALTPHRYFEESRHFWEAFTALSEGCSQVGSVQIRQRGTIGGNICNAVPSADSVAPLLLFDADCVIASAKGERIVPLKDFFIGPKRTVLEKDEILKGIKVYKQASGTGSRYIKYTRRKAMDLALCGVSVLVALEDGVITKARAALTTSAPTAIRVTTAEEFLIGRKADEVDAAEFGRLCCEGASPRTSWRSSSEFRLTLIQNMAEDAYQTAVKRARGDVFCDTPSWLAEEG